MSRRIGFSKTAPSPRSAPESTNSTPKMWSDQLLGKEKILWIGRPEFSVYDNWRALLAVVVMIAATLGIMSYYKGSSFTSLDLSSSFSSGGRAWWRNPDIVLPLFLMAFLLGVLKEFSETPYFSRYMLSDQRMYIAKIFPWKRIKSYELSPMRRIVFDERSVGSIVFSSEMRRVRNIGKREFPVGFMNIKGAAKVYETMLEAQQRRANGNV